MKKKSWYFYCILFGLLHTAGAVPPPEFEIMSDEVPRELSVIPSNFSAGFFINSRPDAEEKKSGWMFGRIGTECSTGHRSGDENPVRVKKLIHFAAGGQYVTMAFVIKMLMGQKNWKITLSDLKNENGGKITADHLKLRRVISRGMSTVYSQDMLVRPDADDLKKGDLLHYLCFISVPKDTPGGIYRGALSVEGNGNIRKIPVELRVLPYNLPDPDGVFGTYVAGHFDTRKTGYTRYSPKSFHPEQLELMFRFWKTRNLNSPALFHVFPENERQNEKTVFGFGTLRMFAEAMKKAELGGPLCIDTRFMAWHAELCEKKTPGKRAEEYFKDRMKALLQIAEQEKWPELKLFPEEEIGNPDRHKKRTYARFWKPLREVAEGRDYVIDNDIGYNRSDALDRGNDNNFPVIQYNSWEDAALKKAHRNNRKVWAYNYGFSRGSFGFLLTRLGATGNHQWAEMWITNSKLYWQSLAFFKDGVCSGMNYERMQEGISDYRYVQLLREKIVQLRNAGKEADAEKAEKVIAEVSGDIPITSAGAAAWNAAQKESELNLRRWRVALAILDAMHALHETIEEKNTSPSVPGEQSVAVFPGKKEERIQPSGYSIAVPLLENPVLDGMPDLRGANTTGPLRLRVSEETNARAFSSSEEEFRKRIACVWSVVWVSYNKDGILLNSIGNFGTPSDKAKPKYDDGDGNLWREVCMEYFFQKPGENRYYHLIVSNLNRKTMLCDGKSSHKAIKVFSKGNINPAGGLAQEVLVPWSEFGLSQMPEAGSVWKFNACRELHGYKNSLMTWARVMTDFAERDRWGTLIFTGKSGISAIFDKLSAKPVYTGINTVSGILKPQKQDGVLTLNDQEGNTICKKKIKAGIPEPFVFRFEISEGTPAAAWLLKFQDLRGRTLESSMLPVTGGRLFNVMKIPDSAVAGQSCELSVLIHISDASIRNYPLEITAVMDDEIITYPEILFSGGGENRLRFTLNGMKPGKYNFTFRMGSHMEQRTLKVLPPFTE